MQKRPFEFSEKVKQYSNEAGEAAFLLGGIGTGNLSVGARGDLRDWEIFNRPNKGIRMPYTFFAVWAKEQGQKAVCKVLESKLSPPFNEANGLDSTSVAGLPHFERSVMEAEYPFVRVKLFDPDFHLDITMEAFTPFIPLNADDSGIPGAIIRYQVKNSSDVPTDVSIVGSLANAAAYESVDEWKKITFAGDVINEYREDEQKRGLFFRTAEEIGDNLKYGNLSFVTVEKNTTYKVKWLESGWFDGIHDFWDDLSEDGRLEKLAEIDAVGSRIGIQSSKVGSIGVCERLAPGETKTFEFVLTWYFPNRPRGWEGEYVGQGVAKNDYSRRFNSSWEAAGYLCENMERLESDSRKFHDALFGSSYPEDVLDAISSNITALRSNTCFRTDDGYFYGWEGCMDREGSCKGNCTHVWNYAQTLAFLFPELERAMRRIEFLIETDDDGRMAFRTVQTFGLQKWNMLPAADGQLGTVIRLYREWKLSGDNNFLEELWPKASKALDFAFRYWDSDGDYILDAQQHNTYDIEFYGPNPLTGILFYAALTAGVKMAEAMHDAAHTELYGRAVSAGAKRFDALLWNGEYYEQRLENIDSYRYQFGKGCLSDQLLGQFLAHVTGLGTIMPEEHVKKAIQSIYRYNFRDDLREHENVQRTYALNDEAGLLLCTWPNGCRPRIPFVYSDEVWTGIEYEVASELIYNGFVEEGIKVVSAVRKRYDGVRRNPWDELECGHHYARSMASWGLLLALSGFTCDMTAGQIAFAPKVDGDFSTFWSTGKAWGTYKRQKDPQTGEWDEQIEVLYGDADAVHLCHAG